MSEQRQTGGRWPRRGAEGAPVDGMQNDVASAVEESVLAAVEESVRAAVLRNPTALPGDAANGAHGPGSVEAREPAPPAGR